MRAALLPLLASVPLLSLGCVPKKDHDALQLELDGVRATVLARDASIAERDQTVVDLEQALAAARAESGRLGSELADKQAALTKLQGEHASLIKDRSRLKGSVEEMQAALAELASRKAAADARVSEFRDLLSRFQALIDAGRLQVRIVDGRMVVQMATDILFQSGKADLSDEGRAALIEVAAVLADIPDRRYQVEGHTDDVPIQTAKFPSNWELASARSVGVVKAMVEAGLSPERLSAASFSQYHPVSANDDKAGKAANRRIEIVVVPDLSQLPGFDALQKIGEGA